MLPVAITCSAYTGTVCVASPVSSRFCFSSLGPRRFLPAWRQARWTTRRVLAAAPCMASAETWPKWVAAGQRFGATPTLRSQRRHPRCISIG